MTPGTYDFPKLLRGDTFTNQPTFTIKSNDIPIDLTDYEIKMEIRLDDKKGRLLKTLAVGTGVTITDPINGVFQINNFEIDLPVGTHYYDMQFTSPAGVVKTYLSGKFIVVQDVTK